jgi:hypothetical protein
LIPSYSHDWKLSREFSERACHILMTRGDVKMDRFLATIIIDFCVALGLVLGGSMVGAVGALLTHTPPMQKMTELADQLKIWAMIAAIGGSVDPIKVIGEGVWDFKLNPVLKQFSLLIAAFLGSQVGYYLIKWLTAGK